MNFEKRKKKKFLLLCLASLCLVLFLRLISLSWSPLFDTTEARYAGIAEEIILQNDWITLRMPALHEPFLAKPPFSFWFIAFCYKLFGLANEFTARFPNFIASILVLIFTYLIARKFYDKRTALIAPLILYSSIFFFIQAGTVDLDMWVCFTTTAGLWAYLNIEKNRKEFWKKTFWEAIFGLIFGFGMLNRGPLSLVLILGTLFLYAVWTKKLKDLILTNWFLVFGAGFLVAYPWYSAAQMQNHDFYEYFFVNEHWNRYLKPDYGDRYGSGHHQPKGMSWVFTIGAFMPWTLILFPFFQQNFKNIINSKSKQFNSLAFLLSWFIFTPLFFTFAKSILMTYILSSLPALSIICARTISLFLHKTRFLKEGEMNNHKNLFFQLLFETKNSINLIIISILVMATGLYMYSTSKHYSVLPFIKVLTITGFIIFISFLIYIYQKYSIDKRIQSFLLISFLGIPFMMPYWYGPLSQSIGDNKSTKQIIWNMKNRLKDLKDYNIFFFEDEAPYSWYFYMQAPLVKQILKNKKDNFENNYKQVHQTNIKYFIYKPKSSQKALMIVKQNNLAEFKKSYPAIYTSGNIAKAGQYYVYKVV